MSGPATVLRELHRLRRAIKDLEGKIENGPRVVKAQRNKLSQQDEGLKGAQEALKQVKVRMHDKEVSIKASQAQITKYEKQRNEATSKKEYDTLGAEIKSAKDHIAKLEDELLELMGEAEETAKRTPEAEKVLQKAKADFAQFEKDQQEKLQRFNDEITRARAELKEVEATLPAEVRPQYERMVKAMGADAIASVTNAICSACYTEITPQMLSDLNRELFVQCKNCGRILYIEGGAPKTESA